MKTFEQYTSNDKPKVGDVYKANRYTDKRAHYIIIYDDSDVNYKYINIYDYDPNTPDSDKINILFSRTLKIAFSNREKLEYDSNVIDFLKNNSTYLFCMLGESPTNHEDSIIYSNLLHEIKQDKEIKMLIESEELGLL